MLHVNLGVILMVEYVIQIKSGITLNVDVGVKNIYVKKIIIGILLDAVAKMVKIQQAARDYMWSNYRRNKNCSSKF